MRIEYSGTLLEQVLKLAETRPIDFVYLNATEFKDVLEDAISKNILKKQAHYWLTVADIEIVFYIDQDA